MTKIRSLPRNGATLTAGLKELPSCFFFIDVEENGICWTELSAGSQVSLRKIQLSNIGSDTEIVSVHNVCVAGPRCMLIVVTKVVSRSNNYEEESNGTMVYTHEHYSKLYHLFTYLVEREEEIVEWDGNPHLSYDVSLTPLQVFPRSIAHSLYAMTRMRTRPSYF